MSEVIRRSIEWGGRTLTLETGKIARQADGAVLCSYGDTVVLAAVVVRKEAQTERDFFPLTVHYQEKAYAAGKIPGGFFKREGRPSEKEVLTSRLIDRPIRPLFPAGFFNEIQVTATVLSHDLENDPDIVAMLACSAALAITGAPFAGPIGAVRVGYVDGAFIFNPTLEQLEETRLDLVVAATEDAVMMVESEAKELKESTMLDAVTQGHAWCTEAAAFIKDFAALAAKPPLAYTAPDLAVLEEAVTSRFAAGLRDAYAISDKAARVEALGRLRAEAMEILTNEGPPAEDRAPNFTKNIAMAMKKVESACVRGQILEKGTRIDGRSLNDIRKISCEPGIISRAHGSALFTRGETQALVVATLGTGDDEQMLDLLEGMKKETFLLHYNFPPYSVGETGRVGSPGRREIGHGKLAWRAIRPVLPTQDQFPYVLRVVSEITESNGSSSMATVCGASLALMDAGVPLLRPVAGIAMGLVLEKDGHAVLSDILGDEDHLGDMDFKVAGTSEGITSLQMDIKVAGVTREIMDVALQQAHAGRVHILEEMSRSLSESRPELGEHVPRIETMTINVSKIREVIGSGGKVIREIVEKTGAKIDIADDGFIKVASSSRESIDKAMDWIRSIVEEPEVGKIYSGKVVKTTVFGAFVNFFGQRDGLVHISQLSRGRPKEVTDIVKEGDTVHVKFVGTDDRGKVRLSMKVVDQQTGKEFAQS